MISAYYSAWFLLATTANYKHTCIWPAQNPHPTHALAFQVSTGCNCIGLHMSGHICSHTIKVRWVKFYYNVGTQFGTIR